MKRLFIILAIAALSTSAFGADVFTHGQFGTTFQSGAKSEITVVTAGDIPLSTDTVKKYVILSRTGYFFQDRPGTEVGVKGAYEAICGLKYFNVGKVRLNGLLGMGAMVEAQDGGSTRTLIKGEFGLTIFESLTFSLGADYFPIDVGPDKTFAYIGIDFTP